MNLILALLVLLCLVISILLFLEMKSIKTKLTNSAEENLQADFLQFKAQLQKLEESLAQATSNQRVEIGQVRQELTQNLQNALSSMQESLHKTEDSLRGGISQFEKTLTDSQKKDMESLRTEISTFQKTLTDSQKKDMESLRTEISTFQKTLTDSQKKDMDSLRTEVSSFEKTLHEELLKFEKEFRSEQKSGVEGLHSELAENQKNVLDEQRKQYEGIRDEQRKQADSLNTAQSLLAKNLREEQSTLGKSLRDQQSQQSKSELELLRGIEDQFSKLRLETKQSITDLQKQNQDSLDKINGTVNEKLQKTLNERIAKSFETVQKQLETVHQGLGEMQVVAHDVKDLRNVLSNVKTSGIMGEIQLQAILEEILAPEQFDSQVQLKKNSSERVDFAVRLPGNTDDGHVWLPIDSKFPNITYRHLLDAYESGDANQVKQRQKELKSAIKAEAKSIRNKYVLPPNTTNFAILFFPIEGLYAEAVKLGLVEELQRENKVSITGPSTMAAMLNALQMGFQTLAIQKKSAEVWSILSSAKVEFNNFEKVLSDAKKNIDKVGDDLDKLLTIRTRKIKNSLINVEAPALFEDSSSS